MPKAQLVAPLCVVIMDDGGEHEVQSTNIDMLAYERTARAKHWPAAQDAPMEAATFVAYHALKREGLIPPDLDYDAFTERALSIETRRVVADPTPEVPEGE